MIVVICLTTFLGEMPLMVISRVSQLSISNFRTRLWFFYIGMQTALPTSEILYEEAAPVASMVATPLGYTCKHTHLCWPSNMMQKQGDAECKGNMINIQEVSVRLMGCSMHTWIPHEARVLSRVNNKKGKRVSDALYTLCKMFSESHASGIQNWPMRVLDSNGMLWVWPRVQANASAISTESTSRSQYKANIHEESSIKLMKNTPILLSSKKDQVFSPLSYSHVHTAASHVRYSPKTYYMGI